VSFLWKRGPICLALCQDRNWSNLFCTSERYNKCDISHARVGLEWSIEFYYFISLQKLKRNRRRRKCRQTIRDRAFVSFVQFFLHKCGEVTFGKLHIMTSANGNRPIIINTNKKYRRMPLTLADVPIPENVKNFEIILIRLFSLNQICIK
jgi:hypothetical protein